MNHQLLPYYFVLLVAVPGQHGIELTVVDESDIAVQVCDAAIKEAKSKGDCSSDNINIKRVDGCVPLHPALGTLNAAEVYYTGSVDAYIAPFCVDEMEEIAKLSYFYGKPVLSRVSASPDLLNVDNYPNVVNFATSTHSGLGIALSKMADKLQLTTLALVGPVPTEDQYTLAQGLYEFFSASTDPSMIKVKAYIKYSEAPDEQESQKKAIKQTTKMIVVGSDFVNLSLTLEQIDARDLTSNSFLIVLVCAIPAELCTRGVKDSIASAGIVVVAPIMDNYAEIMETLSTFVPDISSDARDYFSPYLSMYHACYGFCYKSKQNVNNGNTYQAAFVNATFNNILGEVHFDGGGSTYQNYEILSLDDALGNFTLQLKVVASPTFCKGNALCITTATTDENYAFWEERRALRVASCVLVGDCRSYLIPILATLVGSVILIVIGILFFVRRKRRLNMFRMHWKIPKESLKIIENKQSSVKGKSTVERGAGDTLSSKRRAISSYALIGTAKAEFIALKQNKKIRWTKPELKYLFELKQLTHDNLTKFMGICCNDLDNFYILHALIERASLEDFVMDQEFNMDQTFKSAFLRDILKGLQYLHKSPIGYHGLLTVQNCLIDANWVLKLSNFGVSTMINEFVRTDTLRPMEVMSLQSYQVFAPELLIGLELGKNFPKGTIPGDVYSLGMILYYLTYRAPPYERYTLSPRELLDEIMKSNLTPEVSNTDEDPLLSTMVQCWQKVPEQRPKLRQITQAVSKVFVSAKGNLVDQMIKMNEKYAQNLEKIVAERNAMLQVAQEQTDRLLCEMLPASVAQVLKQGGTIPPRSYDSVTVLFCQLVDFPVLCSKSTAEQIISFLNDVFTRFDEIIKVHDAYKVETTGETYMVASGVPAENDGRHIFEIADISLEIRDVSYQYKVPHFPEFDVRVRIGFHCGPIAAGVIGLKSPRYCLFGDTVNFASRMQSNCPPNQIQTSEVTAMKLFDVQEYKLVKRGIVHVKGKGEVNCYWLNEHIHETNHPGKLVDA